MGSAQFFGEYLVKLGVITPDMLIQAVKFQQSIDRPLLAMAIDKGFLTAEQLEILDRERQTTDGTSVDVNISDNGTLSFKQKTPQQWVSDKGLFLAEALVQKGLISLTDVQKLFVQYRKQFLEKDKQFWINQHIRQTILPSLPHKEVVAFFLQITIDTYIKYTKQSVRVTDARSDVDFRDDVEYLFSQKVYGDRDFHFVIGMTEPVILAVASHMLRKTCDEIGDMELDALTEFVNVVVGNALGKLSMKNYKLMAKSPKYTTPTQMRDNLPNQCVAIAVQTVLGEFVVLFFFEEGETVRRALLFGKDKKEEEQAAPSPAPEPAPKAKAKGKFRHRLGGRSKS